MLNTCIERDNAPLPLRWGFWHLQCITDAAWKEGVNLGEVSSYTLTAPHSYRDPQDGELLELQPGDVLSMWRDR